MVLAFVLAILTLSGHVGVAHVLVLAALLGVVNAIDSPTRHAFVPEMVGRENLASAVALNTTMVTGASFVGPAIAGVTPWHGQHGPAHLDEHADPGHDPRCPSGSCDGDLVHDLHGLCPRWLRHCGIRHGGFRPTPRSGRRRCRVRSRRDRLCPLVVDEASLERRARAVCHRGAASGRRPARESRGVARRSARNSASRCA